MGIVTSVKTSNAVTRSEAINEEMLNELRLIRMELAKINQKLDMDRTQEPGKKKSFCPSCNAFIPADVSYEYCCNCGKKLS